jgi:hypothetical protein
VVVSGGGVVVSGGGVVVSGGGDQVGKIDGQHTSPRNQNDMKQHITCDKRCR